MRIPAHRSLVLSASLAIAIAFAGCSTLRLPWLSRAPESAPRVVVASWYGNGFKGRTTASGRRFDPEALTAAHRTLPFGTKLRIRNPKNGRTVVVVVTDRGPGDARRDIDLSLGAARALGLVRKGVAKVEMAVVGGSAILTATDDGPFRSRAR